MIKKAMQTVAMATVLAVAAIPAPASALDANVYIIHGINGTDLGFPEPLPVDISVNGACAIEGFTFTEITPAVPLPAGQYDIVVSVDDGTSCEGPVATTATVDLAVLENATIIASLNEEGSPTLSKYTNDLRDTAYNRGRLGVRHNAAAPPVVIRVFDGRRLKTNWRLDNPGDNARELRADDYRVSVLDDSRGLFARHLVSIPLTLPSDTAVFVHAVGSLANGTFTVIPLAIPLN